MPSSGESPGAWPMSRTPRRSRLARRSFRLGGPAVASPIAPSEPQQVTGHTIPPRSPFGGAERLLHRCDPSRRQRNSNQPKALRQPRHCACLLPTSRPRPGQALHLYRAARSRLKSSEPATSEPAVPASRSTRRCAPRASCQSSEGPKVDSMKIDLSSRHRVHCRQQIGERAKVSCDSGKCRRLRKGP